MRRSNLLQLKIFVTLQTAHTPRKSVGAAIYLFQQFARINTVIYYSTPVLHSARIASDVAASALVGAANVFGTIVASSLMDKQGRKSLLITSFSGMAASMLLLSVFYMEGPSTIFWPHCCHWHCYLCVILLSWCWSCSCTSSTRDICF